MVVVLVILLKTILMMQMYVCYKRCDVRIELNAGLHVLHVGWDIGTVGKAWFPHDCFGGRGCVDHGCSFSVMIG